MDDKSQITKSELMFFLLSTVITVGIFQLPYDMVKAAGQDGWIVTAMAVVYPLYIIFISSYIIKKFPNDSLINISKKHLGKILGSLMSFLYLVLFLIILSSGIAGFTNILRTYGVIFLPKEAVIIAIALTMLYLNTLGLKNLGRMGKLTFNLTLIILLISIGTFSEGSLLNLKPVLQDGIVHTIKAVPKGFNRYTGMEMLLLIHPYVKEKEVIKKVAIKSIAIMAIILTFAVFITTYYLGPDIVVKTLWPFSLAIESVNIPVINNARFIFTFISIIAVVKIYASYYHILILGISEIMNIDKKTMPVFFSGFIVILALFYKNEIARRIIMNRIMPYSIGFDALYITFLCLITYIKTKKDKPINSYNTLI